MNKKLTKALAITILSSMTMVGCGTVEKSVDINSTTPVQQQQVTPNTKTYKKPVVRDDEGKQPTQKVNKPVENKTTDKTVETVKPNTTKQNTTKTQTQKTQTTKNKVDMTPNNPNVMPDNTPGNDDGSTPWNEWSEYDKAHCKPIKIHEQPTSDPVTENEKEYIKQYGHQSKYDDGEWKYNPYTGETRE